MSFFNKEELRLFRQLVYYRTRILKIQDTKEKKVIKMKRGRG
jgi:hypothetical protein